MNNKKLYEETWENYKSDYWKTKKTMQVEIRDLISLGDFNKNDLVKIRDFIKERAFKK